MSSLVLFRNQIIAIGFVHYLESLATIALCGGFYRLKEYRILLTLAP